MEQKIKQKGINIGGNIRQIRKMKNIGQTELARMVQLNDVYMTREMLVKIERGIQHITGAQLKGIRDCLNTTYDELLKEVHSYTQEEVGSLINYSQQSYSDFECGIAEIPIYVLMKLAELYGTSLDYLLGLTNVSVPYSAKKKRKWYLE